MDKNKRKLKFMSFQEKLKAIELIGKGKSQRKIAKELGIGRTTLYNALKNREKIVEASKKFPEGTNKRRISTTKHPEIERAVLDFIAESRENGERLTGSTIQAIALETAAKLGFDDFSGSNGWLFSFFKRNNIKIKELNEGTEVRQQRLTRSVNDDSYESEMATINESSTHDDIREEFVYSETIESEEYSAVFNWQDWCRVCGNTETLPEVEHNVLEIILKLLNLSHDESIKLCSSCHNSFQVVSEMINRSKFVENMFIELEEYAKTNYVSHEDIVSIRERYDMKNDIIKEDLQSQSESMEAHDVKGDPTTTTATTYHSENLEGEGEYNILFEEDDDEEEEGEAAAAKSPAEREEDGEVVVGWREDEEEEDDSDSTVEELESHAVEEHKEVEAPNEESPKTNKKVYQRLIPREEDKRVAKKSPEEDLYTYTCHICLENFERMCFLSNHTRKMHDCLPQVACTCGRLLATWDSLMAHRRKHSSEPRDWICDICNAKFITKNGLTIHIKFKHQTQQPLHLCTICGKEFKDSYTLKSHERTHLPDEERYIYECQICAKKFTQRGSLKIHINSVHHGQKSIMCHLCSKGFSSNHYLKIHILTHSIENVRCDICDSVFKNRVSLQNHKKKIHKPKELLNFSCTVCDRRFHNRNHLDRHMPTHTGERNFKCTYESCGDAGKCGVSYKWEKDLRNHMSRHYGERRHKCLWCDRMFVDSGNMRKHKIRYHADELAEFELKYGKRRRMKDLILDSEETQQQQSAE